jgi:hypothetical protein
LLNRARADTALIKGLMRLPERMSDRRKTPRMEDVVATKTEFNGIGGSANYISIVSICATPSWLGNGRFIGHARDRCLYRRCGRSNCACSGLFTLGTKWTQMTPPKAVGLARCDHPARTWVAPGRTAAPWKRFSARSSARPAPVIRSENPARRGTSERGNLGCGL